MTIYYYLVLDCRVGEWGEWSTCDTKCGRGLSRRSRTILHPASNGGIYILMKKKFSSKQKQLFDMRRRHLSETVRLRRKKTFQKQRQIVYTI